MREYFEKMYTGSENQFTQILIQDLGAEKKRFVVTANPEIFMLGRKNSRVHELLCDRATTIVPDGIGLIAVGRRLGYDFAERIPGVELCERLLHEADRQKKTVYLFGGRPDVNLRMARRIESRYPNVRIAGATHGYVEDKDQVFARIRECNPDIILVALGMPQQELLIYRHFKEFEKGIFVGVGGSFDVLSGTKKRAPHFFVKCNIEWLYRVVTEPKRLKRFWDNNIKFLWVVFRDRRKIRRN